MTLHDIISTATGAGYRVRHDADYGGWVIDTPKAFRRPSETLASWKSEDRAWMVAAFLAMLCP